VLKRVIKVRRYKRHHSIDYSYSFGSTANIVNALSGRPGNTKVYTGLRSSLDMDYPSRIRMFIQRSDAVIACSKEIRDILKRDYGANNAKLLYNPVDIDLLSSKAEEPAGDAVSFGDGSAAKDIKRIVLTGREDPAKGYWHMLKAFSVLTKKAPEARLIIAGAGEFREYKELAQKLNIAELVKFTGLLLNPFPCVKSADLYVLSSVIEGYPNALIEAMALGRPCIAADCRTGPREILLSEAEYNDLAAKHPADSISETIRGEYGILVPDMDGTPDLSENITDEDRYFASELYRILEDADLLKNYSKKALERAKEMTPSKYIEELTDILK
nr:glycosyltransferase [Lachnospiraceae bacterium]